MSMSRKSLAVLTIWLLTAVACGSEDTVPSSTDTPSEEGTVTTTTTPTAESGTNPEPEPETSTSAADDPNTETSDPEPNQTETSVSETTVADPPAPPDDAPTTTIYSGPVSPITGLPVQDPELLNRNVLAVKVDNHPAARPQSGIEQAEAVYEVMVEGGLTRFIALFHHSDSAWVGPMRSARPTDWTLLQPLSGVMLISGAQPWITRRITNNNVPLIGDSGPPLTARWGQRVAPHNLYVDTYQGRRVVDERGIDRPPPPALFKRGPLNSPEGATAGYIFFDWSSVVDVSWLWNGERYVRLAAEEPHEWRSREGEQTDQISADVLVVLMAEGYTACPQGEGSCVPAWDTVGENRAIVFAEGSYVEGNWRRDRAADWFVITDQSGEEITVPAGRPWIIIYPDTEDVTW